jgi:hypothetical protein
MDDNGDEPISFEEMLTEMSERGTAALRTPSMVGGKGMTAGGLTLGPGVSVGPGGTIGAAAQQLVNQAGIAPPGGGFLSGLPTWWPYAAVGLGAVGVWWYVKKGK